MSEKKKKKRSRLEKIHFDEDNYWSRVALVNFSRFVSEKKKEKRSWLEKINFDEDNSSTTCHVLL